MEDLSPLLALVFLFTFLVSKLLQRLRIPWIFAALILGFLFSMFRIGHLFTSPEFAFLSQLGMYFLVFMIGFEVNVREMLKLSKQILSSTFSIVLSEAFFGTLLIHFLFGYSYVISFAVALSFATVGEAVSYTHLTLPTN